MSTDLLTDFQGRIDARLEELRPLVIEYGQLEAALEALNGVPTKTQQSKAAQGGRTNGAAPARRGRPRGGGRRQQIIDKVTARPGSKVSEIAEDMGLKNSTSLYQPVRQLVEEGILTKNGHQLFPA